MFIIKLPVNVVATACQELLSSYDDAIEKERQEMIQKLMNRRFFSPKNTADAIKKLQESGSWLCTLGYSLWDKPTTRFASLQTRIHTIQKTANLILKFKGNQIPLTTDDLLLLEPYLK